MVYGANEAATIGVARLLVEKAGVLDLFSDFSGSGGAVRVRQGWESVHALTGGFEEILQSYPEVVEGTAPDRPPTSSHR